MPILRILLYPILEQVAFDAHLFKGEDRDAVAKSIVALWLLSLIVVGCGYKSKLISAMVIPDFSRPPTTFEELVNSNYSINAILYVGNVETDLEATNYSITSRMIMSRVVEYDYTGPECYKLIFEGPNVCLGYDAVINGVGIEVMVDIHGRKMWTVSKDSHFPTLMPIGISKFYPMFLKPLNDLVQIHSCMGFSILYDKRNNKKKMKKGQMNALRDAASNPYYEGLKNTNAKDEGRQFAVLTGEIFVAGVVLSILVVVLEWLRFYWEKRKHVDDVIIMRTYAEHSRYCR